ncbi:MAG: hypothetical protein AB9856_04575 [Cellulosilyticaceae bacterium]
MFKDKHIIELMGLDLSLMKIFATIQYIGENEVVMSEIEEWRK